MKTIGFLSSLRSGVNQIGTSIGWCPLANTTEQYGTLLFECGDLIFYIANEHISLHNRFLQVLTIDDFVRHSSH